MTTVAAPPSGLPGSATTAPIATSTSAIADTRDIDHGGFAVAGEIELDAPFKTRRQSVDNVRIVCQP
jgi:hypothetical protein